VITGKLRAWIEHCTKQGVLAAFIGVPEEGDAPLRRLPAGSRNPSGPAVMEPRRQGRTHDRNRDRKADARTARNTAVK
jgi:hypothetical protein